ncbi:PKD domain-containing protein [Saccharicrinis sp. 156]|uniref:PKD domain-containing protein n=1 Tax=Saccharicrinis sp. 156 TaxID=3417574 RepID=UPI003D354E06
MDILRNKGNTTYKLTTVINQHSTPHRLGLCIILFTLIYSFSFGQDCTHLSKGNDIHPIGKCAPVDVDWEVTYYGVNDKGTATIQIQYDWDDGTPVEVIDATLINATDRDWQTTHSHTYPNTGNQCNYHPRVALVVNGVVCTSSEQEQIVTVWDTDDQNGGYLAITPDPKPICVGNDALFHFEDVSQWNCTPPDENDVINNADRWVQWIYGTGGSTIANAQVDGSVRAYPWSGSIDYMPGPVEAPSAPYNTTLDIYIPTGHPVGAFFEVTLRNWNVCNPYDADLYDGLPPADPINGDFPPVTTTAQAIIVDLPDASIHPVAAVCESEDPFLLIAADGGGQWAGPGISDPWSAMFDPEIAGPGTHSITYSITDGNGCSDVGTVNIQVLESPKADIAQGDTTHLCPGVAIGLDGNPSSGTAPYTHSWSGQTGSLSSTSIVDPDFTTATSGQYELIYRVEDQNTCWSSDTIIMDVQQVNISITNNNIEVCLGTNITLDPKPSGGSNAYIFHQWTGTRTDKLSATDIQSPVFTADEAGTFQYNYTVRDTHGCQDTKTITITVDAQPIANAGNNIDECGLQTILTAMPSIGTGSWKTVSGPGNLAFSSFSLPDPNVVADTYGTYVVRWIEENNGCVDSADINLSFTEIPLPAVMEDKDTCGLSIQLIAFKHVGTGKWTKAEGTGTANFNNDASEITNVTVDTPGTFKFAWNEDNGNGCVGGDTVEINFFQLPDAQITPPPAVGCTPLEIEFENTSSHADNYYWDFGNGIISNLENPQLVFTNKTPAAVDYEITLIARTLNGCADTTIHSVKVAPTPISYFEIDEAVGCTPLESNFTNKSQGGSAYEWMFGDGTDTITSENAAHLFINPESYTQSFEVQLVTENAFGCTDTSELYTTVYPRQEFNLSANPDSGCSPLNADFVADIGAFKYEWDFGDGNLVTGGNVNAKLFSNNNQVKEKHKVTLYTTSGFGCLDTAEVTVTVLPSPTAKFVPNDFAICSPKNILFENNSENTVKSYWEFGDGDKASTSDTENIEHTFTNDTFSPLNYRIRLIAENSFGCKDSLDGFTTVNPSVHADISEAVTDCAPFEANFANNSTGANSYLWDYGDGNTSAGVLGQNIFENATDEELTFDVQMIASSPYGCSDTASVEVKALPSPNTYFEPNDFSVCSPKSVTFTNYTENIVSSTWNFGDGTSATMTGNESVDHIYSNDHYTPKEFKIKLLTENSFGCKDSMEGYTSVKPNVVAKITGDSKGCSPLEVSFGNESEGANDFIWDYGDRNTSESYLGLNMFKNNTDADIEYDVSMIANSPYGCSDTAYTKVTVYATPNVDFSVAPQELQMPESTIEINNLTQGDIWEYQWDFGDSNTSTERQPNSYTYTDYGEYDLSLRVYSDKCENTIKKGIIIIAGLPTVEYGPPTEGCPALKVDFYSNATNVETYHWDFGDGNISADPNPTHIYYTEGTYTVTLTVEGPGGTTIKDDLKVEVYPEPTALFDVRPNVVTIPGEGVTFVNQSMDADSYLWRFGDGQTSTDENPVYNYTSAGNFDITLDAENEFGCTNSYIQYQAVTAKEGGEITFPNAFTPNTSGPGDGRYDRTDNNNYIFHPAIQKGVVEYKLQIFTRWGQLVFESEDIEVGWNGYHKKQLCSQGVYIWKVSCRFSTGQFKVYTGDVTLLR